ncbi:tryptophan synthase subunit alpha [Fulvivirga sedimenti]|uniref:Tryptophan synthase alpha chain n=1 Tax=Fulvivirga sedimenti TaxID=2879465 RepID=A0A9X1KWT0_9BACT|nr:tryptophan synthase subunit alpha [Fulvivirga sedimenti]MCA6073577.1 tryptophan synthase subunit alpha [Fulvivirga sedimenti]
MTNIEVNRISRLFESDSGPLLSVYFTAGFPEINDTINIAAWLEEGGADIIEIGMPFSDPIADGPTIQESNTVALHNGMKISVLFEQLKGLRERVQIPVILMGYINPVLQYGIDRFCEKCRETGIDGLILPDLPMAEYIDHYKERFEKAGLKNIFLITPQTGEARIREIDANTDGFIYMVSSASTTGAKSGIGDEQIEYFKRIKAMGLQNPALVGFGISNHETFKIASSYSRGAIIGSAFIKMLQSEGAKELSVKEFVKNIKNPR